MDLQTIIKEKIISRVYRMGFNLVSYLPVKKKTIMFESFNGKVPSDNPLAIYQELSKDASDFHIYWSVKNAFLAEAQQVVPAALLVKRFSLKWLWLTARANFWIFNARMPHWLRKNKGTTYIQTWHGTPLKRLGLDIDEVAMPGTDTASYKKYFIQETSRWDYMIAPNPYSEAIFKEAFAFQNTFLEIGYPRNDRLFQADAAEVQALKERYLGTTQGRVLLYAPTWRDDAYYTKGQYKFELPFSLETVVALMAPEDRLILRPHYLVKDQIDISGYETQVVILADEEISDLYLISDLLITDYSSVFFDFANLRRPMLFYAYDLDHYRDQLRGFYFDYQQVPGPIATEVTEFYYYLKEFLQENAFLADTLKLETFVEEFGIWENGTASQKVVELLGREGSR
ncbi:glycerophosphotransferase [Enterococcus canis]|uniref:Glycerophosphotransferase n=1 Tax=Enterococcus canis TaxID=214095 RepID=A0A1L8RKK4_9ENTE|nr:CDP-glycerol glycerophosphotransferase family protein [Enterococcus canis]OJG20222.1 glycerophosphotransferase [Enterococcus canis]